MFNSNISIIIYSFHSFGPLFYLAMSAVAVGAVSRVSLCSSGLSRRSSPSQPSVLPVSLDGPRPVSPLFFPSPSTVLAQSALCSSGLSRRSSPSQPSVLPVSLDGPPPRLFRSLPCFSSLEVSTIVLARELGGLRQTHRLSLVL